MDEMHPIQGLHDRTQKDFRAAPPEQLAANREVREARRPVTAFELETGQRANPFDHEKDPSQMPPAKQPGAVPKTAFELEMMGGRKKEAPLDAQESASSSPPRETVEERIARLQSQLSDARDEQIANPSPPPVPETPVSAEKVNETKADSPSEPSKQPNKKQPPIPSQPASPKPPS